MTTDSRRWQRAPPWGEVDRTAANRKYKGAIMCIALIVSQISPTFFEGFTIMRNAVFSTLSALVMLTLVAGRAQATDKEDAMALVAKAVEHVKKHGVETACKDFAEPKAGFIQGELYVFVQDMQAKMICNASNAKLNGKDLSQLKDADGQQFSKAMADLAKSKGSGWVDYRWINPVTKAIEPKSSYVQRVNDSVWLGVGLYRR